MKQSIVIAVTLFALAVTSSMATVAVSKASVKVVLHDTATVMADDNGFFTLGEISDISGGTAELRDKLNNVEVGRAPLDSYVRHLNLGDVALKLRQAGVDPNRDLKLSGAENIVVSTAAGRQISVKPNTTLPSASGNTSPAQSTSQAPQVVIKRGDPVTIVLQDGTLTVTALGQSRDNGAVGDMIHVHRDGVMTDILVQVVDDHTVHMEM